MGRARRGVRIGAVVVVIVVVVILGWPAPIRAVPWEPPAAPGLDGPFAPNSALTRAQGWFPDELAAPERVAVLPAAYDEPAPARCGTSSTTPPAGSSA